MNITRENIDELNIVLKMKIEKEDYEPQVDKVLREHRRKMTMPGFRQGKVPLSIVKKMYGKSAVAEEVNKLIQDKLFGYIKDEKLDILGEPLPSEKYNTQIDIDNEEVFDVAFDLGLSPKVDLDYTKNEEFPIYEIEVDEKLINESVENYREQAGENKPVDIIEGEELLKGSVKELKEDGVVKEDAVVSLKFFKDEAEADKFKGANKSEIIKFNLKKALPSDVEISHMLGIEKEEVEALAEEFEFTIEDIQKFEKADLGEELYKKTFPEDEIKTEEDFRDKVKSLIAKQFEEESKYKFLNDTKDALVEKTEMTLPEAFLKRWLITANAGKEDATPEKIEEDFPKVLEDIRWQLIKNKIAKDEDIKITEEDLKDFAKNFARMQFQQYGMSANIPDDYLDGYAVELLKKDDNRDRFAQSKLEEKVALVLKDKLTLKEVKIGFEEYKELVNPKPETENTEETVEEEKKSEE